MSGLGGPSPLKRFVGPESWDAIVIGSGIGGLTAASLLAQDGGKRVLVLERHYTPGGFTHAFHRPGYEWDVGVHYIGNVEPGSMVRQLFDRISGGQLEWADMGQVYDRVVIGGKQYEYPKGRANLERMLKTEFPAEQGAIDRYFALIKRTARAAAGYYGEKAVPGWIAAIAGGLMRRPYLRYASRSTRSVLDELTGNQRLIAVLTGQYGDYGLPPAESSFAIHAMVTGHYFGGGFYPVGGAGRIAETVIPTITAAGGAVVVSAPVATILLEGGRAIGVELEEGRRFLAPVVVSDAGVRNTVERLLPADLEAVRPFRDRLRTLPPSYGHFSLYLGAEGTPESLGLPKANYWIYPHERYEQALADFCRDPGAALPLVYISFPAAKDPDFQRRHPGHSTIEAITLAPWNWVERWSDTRWKKRGAEYDQFKAGFADRLQRVVEEFVPGLRGRIRHAELSTPLSTAHFAGYASGEIYGLNHTPARFKERWLKPRTPIKGLYLTGQDISSCGVAGAMVGGVLTASVVLGRNLMRTKA